MRSRTLATAGKIWNAFSFVLCLACSQTIPDAPDSEPVWNIAHNPDRDYVVPLLFQNLLTTRAGLV